MSAHRKPNQSTRFTPFAAGMLAFMGTMLIILGVVLVTSALW